MKKALFTIFMLAIIAIGLTSCSSGEKCPAYSQVEQTAEVPA